MADVPWGWIDWEQARPGRRVEDVAKLCWSFVEPTEDSEPSEIGERWRHLATVYGLDPMEPLLPTVLAQIEACADDIERGSAAGSERPISGAFYRHLGDGPGRAP